MNKFDIEEFVLESMDGLSIKEAQQFAEAHGYIMRVVKIWNKKTGKFSPLICTLDYVSNRINVAEAGEKVHHVEGLG